MPEIGGMDNNLLLSLLKNSTLTYSPDRRNNVIYRDVVCKLEILLKLKLSFKSK